jgi:hypothetical protein
MKDRLNVEIFSVGETQAKNAIDAAVAGVDVLNDIVGNLTIVNVRRKINYHSSNPSRLDSRGLARALNLTADLNIGITNIPFKDESQTPFLTTKGEAVILGDKRTDFVQATSFLETVTAHEVAHLLGQTHCPNESCTMSAQYKTTVDRERIKTKGVANMLERAGLRQVRYTEVEGNSTQGFCEDCKLSLSRRAFWLLRLKNKQFVPQEWLDKL